MSSSDERFSRLLAMAAYPAAAVSEALAVVGGVGALGNELVKNLCLLGFKKLFLIDKDIVERSNLTRSVLFTEQDVGRPKVTVAAAAARRIYPEVRVAGHHGDVSAVGFGVYRRAALIFSDFDSFYPRLFFNEAALKTGKPWIDAALGLDPHRGSVMVYHADDLDRACYVCRIGVRAAVQELLRTEGLIGCQRGESQRIEAGFLPTTPTTSAAIAALQAQAGLDQLYLGAAATNPWLRNGVSLDLRQLTATRLTLRKNDACPNHAPGRSIAAGAFLEANWTSSRTTISAAFADMRRFMGVKAGEELYLHYHTLYKGLEHCRDCGAVIERFTPVYIIEGMKMRGEPVLCPQCGSVNLDADADRGELSAVAEGDFPRAAMTLAEAGFRKLDIIKFFIERDDRELSSHAEIAGDADAVLQPLHLDLE